MQVKSLKAYKDKMLGRMVSIGETLDVSDERGQYLVLIGYAKADGGSGRVKHIVEDGENG